MRITVSIDHNGENIEFVTNADEPWTAMNNQFTVDLVGAALYNRLDEIRKEWYSVS